MALLAILLLVIAASSTQAKRSYYTAAVFEHTGTEVSNETIPNKIKINLDFYKRAAKVAHSKEVDIMVFPEYGVLPYDTRKNMRPFLEIVPDPQEEKATPCSTPHVYADRPILHTLSCIAKNNSMYVVANVAEIHNCTGDPDCKDGAYHYNTNIAFDRNGTLLLRYRKEYLFFEYTMNTPKEKQTPIFKTDFGSFATFVCFDLIFKKAIELARKVDGIAFSTNWNNIQPQFISIGFFQAFAMANNITFLAADRQVSRDASLGSGIFNGRNGALAYTLNPDGISKLVVAKVARSAAPRVSPDASITAFTTNATWEWRDDGKNVTNECRKGDSCITETMLPNYTFVKLNRSNGVINACNNGLCCKLSYTSYGIRENYYFGVFSGITHLHNRYEWCEEVCILVRCEDENGVKCSKFPMKSTTKFHSVFLSGNFTSDVVFPTVLESGARLVTTKYWQQNADKSINTHNFAGIKYINVGLKGRCYDKDPPFRP